MPLYPPRSLEAYKKKELLSKREKQLRHALSSGAVAKVLRAAENVRAAQLAILKAEQELVRYDVETEQRELRLVAIAANRDAWRDMPVEEIVAKYRVKPGD